MLFALVLGSAVVPVPSGAPWASVASVAPVAPVASGRDVDTELARLASPDADERLEAQRWLAVHLSRQDFPSVAGTARGGGAEIERRLALAIGSDDRRLGLAMLLLTDPAPEVERVGRAALSEMLARWSPSILDEPLAPRVLPEPWLEEVTRPLRVDPDAGSLADVVDRLARLGGGPVPIVLDPGLDPAVRRNVPDRNLASGTLAGTWGEVLRDLAEVNRVSFEVLGYRYPGEALAERSLSCVRICKRADEGVATGETHIVDWCRGVMRQHDPSWNAACARALASTDWPAAIYWLEERWFLDGDVPALEGLLFAGARGRVAPSLASASTLRALLLETDRRLAAGTAGAAAHAERLARCLAALGPIGPSGEPLAGVLLERWGELSGTSRWVRLVALEGQGLVSTDASTIARGLVASDADAALRLQALRALARTKAPEGPGTAVGDPGALFARAAVERSEYELGRLLAATRAVPPAGDWWKRISGSASTQLALLEWTSLAGDDAIAIATLVRVAGAPGSPEDAAVELRRWRGLGRGPRLAELFELATDATVGDPDGAAHLRRLALWSGQLDAAAEDAELARLVGVDGRSADELADLGVLAGRGARGEPARQALLDALGDGEVPGEVLRRAIEIAIEGLRRARLDEDDASFQRRLRAAAGRGGHPLAEVFYERDWPAQAPPEARDLDRLDRRLP